MAISILVADSLHINQRNFGSFLNYVEQNKIKIYFENSHKDWIALYGVYDSKLDVLYSKIEFLSKLDKTSLFEFNVNDVNAFSIARAEILSLVSVQEKWYETQYPCSLQGIFDKLYEDNRTVLLQNIAAAWYWIDFWKMKLSELPSFTHCCVFSGSLIYQKSLIEQLKYTPTKVMVMESLFTGNEYYCEERYSSIANNCDIKHKAVYQKQLKEIKENSSYEKERMKAINKIILSKNKNVEQPTDSKDIIFKQKGDVVAIIGQVVNDFSVLEYKGLGLSTISIYKALIKKLTEQGFNVIVKTHPWEEKKTNIKTSLTKQILEKYVSTLPEKNRYRVQIIDHYSIKKLFSQSKWILGLNSQGLLEACFDGFKPIQLANAFYGKKGFTHDYHFLDIEKLVNDLTQNKLNSILSLKEFDLFEEFMTVLLQKHTVSVHNSGLVNLREIFTQETTIPLATTSPIQKTTVPIVVKKENVQTGIKPQSKNTQESKKIAVSKQQTAPKDTVIQLSENIDILLNEKNENRKLKKLKNNPRLFFAESKYSVLRPLKYFFPVK